LTLLYLIIKVNVVFYLGDFEKIKGVLY